MMIHDDPCVLGQSLLFPKFGSDATPFPPGLLFVLQVNRETSRTDELRLGEADGLET